MLWNQLKADSELIAYGYKNNNDIVGKNFADKIRLERVQRKIMMYEIENETDQGNLWYTDIKQWGKWYTSIHVPKSAIEIRQYTAIFDDTVSIINWTENENIGIEIVNRDFAKTQRQIFWDLWNRYKKN